ncbi:MAG: O-methyltransferase [Muribaculaceae bacterium]|nr:O-methyltransferase [Muribaculaceae bacterium]
MQPGIDEYIHRHISPEPEYLRRIDRLTNLRLVNGRMCSGHTQGRLLKMLTAMIRPRHVLELGTFSGYSALCMAEALEEDASLDTVEVCDELEDFIRENLSSSPYGNKVRLHIGDALDVMRQWDDGHFDLIFIDADKRHYVDYFNRCRDIIAPGGFIIADNTLWDGHVLEPDTRSPQTKGIMAFNDAVAADPDFETVMIPLRDGLTILRKIKP